MTDIPFPMSVETGILLVNLKLNQKHATFTMLVITPITTKDGNLSNNEKTFRR
jgi:hypothetical protein